MNDSTARRRTSAAICGLMLLVGGCAAPATGSSESRTSATSATPAPPSATPAPTTATVAVAPARELVNPHWTSLPGAPIAGRNGGVSAWTGSEMIIWGGSSATGEQYFDDGASYDPAHRTWHKLPAAPLSARSGAASAWTGRSLFIWGGTSSAGTLTDGALYTPDTGRWTKVPPAPALPTVDSQHQLQVAAVWTGSRVALFAARSGDGPQSGDDQVAFRLYEPDTNAWTVEPAIESPSGHQVQGLSAVAIGPATYLFTYWTKAQADGMTVGTDGFTVDPDSGASAANKLAPPPGAPVGTTVLAAGAALLFAPGQPFCGFCAGGFVMDRHGVLAEPATGKFTDLPHGPIDDLGPQYVWTGRQLLAFDTQTFTSGPGNTAPQYPGKAAVFSPTTKSWKPLPSGPLAGADGAAFSVWTGASLIEWGEMYLPTSANTGKTTFRAAGLELTG